ncbi:MAG: Lrp/AsnC family transcriptional regulator [Clostridia bacterium]|nr:Lrp/AsnC family transcriptional regulator [Clostridia bacterium]
MQELKNQLIKLLSENARYTYDQLAAMVGADAATVETAVKELEKDGVIVKYSAILNAEALAEKKVNALIEVKVAPQKLKGFDSCAEEIYHFKEVQSLYLMSGGFDLAVFVEGKDITDIAKFVSEKLSVIDGIISVQTHFILKRYKIEGQVTKPDEDNRRQLIQA